jgi:hypothetical protein
MVSLYFILYFVLFLYCFSKPFSVPLTSQKIMPHTWMCFFFDSSANRTTFYLEKKNPNYYPFWFTPVEDFFFFLVLIVELLLIQIYTNFMMYCVFLHQKTVINDMHLYGSFFYCWVGGLNDEYVGFLFQMIFYIVWWFIFNLSIILTFILL